MAEAFHNRLPLSTGGYCGMLTITANSSMFITEASDSFYTMIGYTKLEVEILFDNCLSGMIAEQEPGAVHDAMIRQFDLAGFVEVQLKLKAKDGSIVPIILCGHYLRNSDEGSFWCAVVNTIETQELRDRLSDANNELVEITNGIPAAMLGVLCDDSLTIIRSNDRAYQALGYTEEEYSEKFGGSLYGTILPEDKEKLRDLFRPCRQYHMDVAGEFRMVHKNGETRWASFFGKYFSMRGDIPVYFCIIMDTTPHKQAELEILHTKGVLEQIAQTIQCGIVQYENTPEHKMIYANHAVTIMTGYTMEELNQNGKITKIKDKWVDIYELVKAQAESGENDTCQVVVYRTDETEAWLQMTAAYVHDISGNMVLQAVFTDVSEMKHMQDVIEREKLRYKVILESSESIIFNYSIVEDILTIHDRVKTENGYEDREIVYENYHQVLAERKLVHPDDLDKVEKIYKGEPFNSMEIRFLKPDAPQVNYYWFLVQGSVIFDEHGVPVETVGVMREIDQQKRTEEILKIRAQQDPLTKLYNKAAVRARISEELEDSPDGVHALMIIDIDDFKSVNDNLGHWLGDTVLTDISASLKRMFRGSDIVGRIGGDEFIVFLKDIRTVAMAKEKAEAICEVFRNTYVGEKTRYKISGSIGIALSPQHGRAYEELFKNADMALYTAKRKGKDGYRIYNGTTPFFMDIGAAQTGNKRTGTDDEHRKLRNDSVIDIFEMLLEARDIEAAIPLILRMLGEQLEVARATIFEISDNRQFISNTFEWCADGTAPRKNLLQNLDYSAFKGFKEIFDKDGMFFSHNRESVKDINDMLYRHMVNQGIITILDFAMNENDEFHGFFSFEDYGDERLWEKEEIDSLNLICRTITTYLRKLRLQNHFQREHKLLETILERDGVDNVMINPQNFKVAYRSNCPDIRYGESNHNCYELLMNRKEPCADCPILTMQKRNPRYLITGKQVWDCGVASVVETNHKPLIFVTRLKEEP